MKKPTEEPDWAAITARCLAYLCLKNSPVGKESLLKQAEFLEKLGLPLDDRAGLIGSSSASLRELARQARSRNQRSK